MWLFGQLNNNSGSTGDQAPGQQETIQSAREVGDLLTNLLERERTHSGDDALVTNGTDEKMGDDDDDSAPDEEETMET